MIRAPHAKVAELADAQDSGSCGRKVVGVQVPPFAPTYPSLVDRLCAVARSKEAGVSIDAASFRKIVGNFATGVTVVTTANDGLLHGVTANSLTSVSLDPLLLLVCVDKAAHAHAEMLRCTSFGVNMLSAAQRDISTLFAKTGEPEKGRLRGNVPFRYGHSGCPLLEGAMAHVECARYAEVDAGDHTIFVGRALHGALASEEAEPLLYFRGAYRGVLPV